MTKFTLIIIFACLLFSASFVNSSSNNKINNTNLISSYIKVWGFLKYYHPSLASGKINWDSVFVKQIETIANIDNPDDYNTIIDKLLIKFRNPPS